MRSPLLRWLARLGIAAIAATFVVLVGVQFARLVERNITYIRNVAQVEADIVTLEARRDEQRRTIARLSDPQGAIPEIHDRLHLVGDHEAIIYLKRPGAAQAGNP